MGTARAWEELFLYSLSLKMKINCISLGVAREEEQHVQGSSIRTQTHPKDCGSLAWAVWGSGRGGDWEVVVEKLGGGGLSVHGVVRV